MKDLPASCKSVEEKQNYLTELFSTSFVNTIMDKIKPDPAGRYLNKIMANSVWANGPKIERVSRKSRLVLTYVSITSVCIRDWWKECH